MEDAYVSSNVPLDVSDVDSKIIDYFSVLEADVIYNAEAECGGCLEELEQLDRTVGWNLTEIGEEDFNNYTQGMFDDQVMVYNAEE